MNVRMIDHYPDLVRTARHGGLTREDAEEVAQDALVLLFQKSATQEVEVLSHDSIQNRAGQVRSLRSWLCDVVGLLLRNRIRYRTRHTRPLVSIDTLGAELATGTREREVELLAFGACVFELLDDEEARLLRLDLLGYKSHEIAAELTIPASTVRVRKKRLLDRLRQEPRIRRYAEALEEGEGPVRTEPHRNGREDDDWNDRDEGSGGSGSSGSGSSGSGCASSGSATGKRSASPLSLSRMETLLLEYGSLCRRRGIDPLPEAHPLKPIRPSWRSFFADSSLFGFGPVASAVALTACFAFLISRVGGPLPSSGSGDESATQQGRPETATEATAGLGAIEFGGVWEHVDVAVLPDLPPTIEIFASVASLGTQFPPTHGSAGGGLLQTDAHLLDHL